MTIMGMGRRRVQFGAAWGVCTPVAQVSGAATSQGCVSPAVAQHVPVCSRRVVRVVASDGVQLRVADAGERGAPRTVVFLHGFCLSGASWMGHGDALLRFYGSGLRVISYDHRGHGFSHGGSAASYRIERLAEDLAEILQTLRVRGEVTLVGHSMGAMVALTYMGRVCQPVVPTGLVLVGAAAGRLRQRGLGRALAVPGLRLLCRVGRRTPVGALRMLAQPLCVGLSQVRWAQTAGAAVRSRRWSLTRWRTPR